MAGKIVIEYNNLLRIARKLPEVVRVIVRKTAFDVEANAKAVVPVKTGKLKNSISSEFPSPTRATVAPHTDYAGFVEYGTRKMRARPYMRYAAEKVKPAFIRELKQLEKWLR